MVATKHCCWRECKSDSRFPHLHHPALKKRLQEGKPIFYPFPKKSQGLERCLRWVNACGRGKDFTVDKVTKYTYICYLHWLGEAGPTKEFDVPLKATLKPKVVLKATKPKLKAPRARHAVPTVYDGAHNDFTTTWFFRCKLDSLKRKLDSLKRKLDSLKRKLDSLKRKLESLKRKLDSLKRKLDSLKRKLDSLKRKLDSLKRKLDSLKRKLDSLKRKLDSLKRKLDSLKRKLESLKRKLDSLKRKLAFLQRIKFKIGNTPHKLYYLVQCNTVPSNNTIITNMYMYIRVWSKNNQKLITC